MNIERTEFQTLVFGPYGGDPYDYTLPVLVPVKSGHTKIFPPRASLGPTDADVDDTLSTANWQDLSGGIGVMVINPTVHMSRVWWSTAEIGYTDGWTCGPEVLARQPASFTGNHTPVGRIGTSVYGFWGTGLHLWDADDHTWGASQQTITGVVGPSVLFRGRRYFPTGSNGYSSIAEASAGVLAAPTAVTGAASPSSNSPVPTSNPRVHRFAVYRQQLWAITTSAEGYTLASSTDGATGNWFWPFDPATQSFVKLESGQTLRSMIQWVDALGTGQALWAISDTGAVRFNSNSPHWEETSLQDVPPHPNFGRCAMPFRPGEALWIAGGGGDIIQYTANGVVVPASGPGGRDQGMPVDRRGDVMSMATDLRNLYILVKGDSLTDAVDTTEDAMGGADPVYVSEASATSSVIAYDGKGWKPQWEGVDVVGDPTEIVVAYGDKDNGSKDYRTFWGVGEWSYSMPSRLTTYSAAQGRKRGIDRFASSSIIEFGEFHAGSIANKKLWSHGALLMSHASSIEYAELEYQTEDSDAWTSLGIADTGADSVPSSVRTVLPFGVTGDGLFSEGIANYWVKPRLTLVGGGAATTPVVRTLTLAYLDLRQDATHMQYTVPLPVEVDERTGKTREQIHELIHELMNTELKFLFLKFQETEYRAVITGLSHTEVAARDVPSAIQLNVLQIPSGMPGLRGEG